MIFKRGKKLDPLNCSSLSIDLSEWTVLDGFSEDKVSGDGG